ncbi:nitrate reductase molybdenum cofactor assembly chaperone [Vibrio sp. SS-MA-C1-2]|uniref:nitrate reductase molybdenum cofactor assembly chaperone n=1 Tax=Vibrio sp. SS-MA-C1-2 TaxID=2908646 RepID=UPI001F462E74|nr:nitrate reductase molybdenum cofactor assembly chaperone [Vibrio sp. SS-MA-C1-2]UJF18177.1 nitrate reductase molybdenum cofactor assembly chaperone [Vibrio sp. SS-MA-C1-2]
MDCLKLISLFLDYPELPLWTNLKEFNETIDEDADLSLSQKAQLHTFLASLTDQNKMDAQASFTELFDRGRSLSLLLFEHVHGESRDRGQAMVDLMNQYKEAGLEISSKELPDHLPVYLEYLSTQSNEEATQGLKDIAPILALLGSRLHSRNSQYGILFDVLLELSTTGIATNALDEQVSKEARDDTPEALDAVWEEEQVKFLGEEGCESAQKVSHQKRFNDKVQPQYIDIGSITGDKQ